MKIFLWTILTIALLIVAGLWFMAFRQARDASSATTNPTIYNKANSDNGQAPIVVDPNRSPTVFVPILMYHYIRDYTDQSDPLGIGLSVSPAVFKKQMQTLKNAGYETISLSDFAAGKYKPKSLVVTFDDGYDDQYDSAFPILKELNMKATFFIVHDFVNTPGYMTKTQINSLITAGMEIGGHSMSHKNLANMEYEQQVKDIAGSMKGYTNVFCYPSGKYSPTTLDIVSGLGVKAAVTTHYGIATDVSSLYELPRIRMVEKTDIMKRISEETAIAKKQILPSQRTTD